MNWKEEAFSNFKLYAVTDLEEATPQSLKKIRQVYAGGADIVQLRSKCLSDKALYEFGLEIRKIADQYRKLFFVNDRLDLALAVQADGIHLGQEDMPVSMARHILSRAGVSMWIGKSTHSPEQGDAAVLEKPDYLGVGPVFPTPTKPGYNPVGFDYVRYAAAHFSVPFVAIGGIDLKNLTQVLEAGARRIAVVRALFQESNPESAALQFKKKIEGFSYATR